MTESAPPISPNSLRDRLRAVLVEFEVSEPERAVEAVCDQMTGWLRVLAADWYSQSSAADLTGQAIAPVAQAIADGIESGRPDVSPQDPGVQ